MPRYGMTLVLAKEFDNVNYYGKGPFENYIDRNTASKIGLYEAKVADFYVPYIRPQENGNKTDVRWLTLTNEKGAGIKIKGLQPLSVSALHNSIEDFGQTRRSQGLLYNRVVIRL